MNTTKDLKPLFRKARKQGFTIRRGRKWKVTAPDGRTFGVALTPSDPLALKRITADFRRHGLKQ